ncbi:electron transport complex subunit RsxC [Treponema sp.]|uniref:electron transport complex subunit RsxC n=1 Tax=Treponema sp. TaxID=166 RepID=UPI00298E2E14|nr:electron transport complex subunit RsxC [Treponema sp.]MCR5613116.1 electron transport complex subunit RsxC [Treponema sp.]
MKEFTFKGGVHPKDRKERSRGKEITFQFPSTQTVTIPVTMGGAPNSPLVNVGDQVVKGQVIANGTGTISCPVHASITGKVKKISTHLVAGGAEALCITIEENKENPDDRNKTAYMDPLDPFTCTRDEAIERIHQSGITGMGGASFPTFVKFKYPADTKIEHLIINAAECEPYLTIDESLLAEKIDRILDGIRIVQHIVSAPAIIALEKNKAFLKDSIQKKIDSLTDLEYKIEVCIVKTKYPQGAEKNLITALTKKEVPSGALPFTTGCIICNVGTVNAISDAFRLGKPLIERPLTISGDACKTPMNIVVPIGTLVGDLIPQVVQLEDKVSKILHGGPMMGQSMQSADFPVQKGTSGVLFLTEEETGKSQPLPCIGCGRCISVCPMQLEPVLMSRAVNCDDIPLALKKGLMDCIECGSCSFICPSDVPLVQIFKLGKKKFRDSKGR